MFEGDLAVLIGGGYGFGKVEALERTQGGCVAAVDRGEGILYLWRQVVDAGGDEQALVSVSAVVVEHEVGSEPRFVVIEVDEAESVDVVLAEVCPSESDGLVVAA